MIEVALKGMAGAFAIDAHFNVPAQGVTAIWGPSGAGKSTLLRAIAGLTRLSGHVRIGDQVWQDGGSFTPVHHRRIGYVFQEASLFGHLTVRGNLLYALKRNGGQTVDYDGWVERLKLTPLLTRRVGQLSGGERQRVALARTLMSAPDLLLMDEPLSSLDGEARAEIVPMIADLARHSGLPILYVSHDAYEVERLADRILRMSHGRILDVPEPAPPSLDGLDETQVRRLALAALKAGIRG
ncbi:ATP-binding cassette domain-containing protein [Asticcacaulis sp. EMRT-3]|uniref:molybdenum ABC transporter ATP-binding protein n=1 Tax=Asticcacaulis sp. EMRT-3 TaxID=3040349 RepID=UPI0024AF8C51|nr:ATP-binding cassette domain-containing protein [Asticcacaulis sp. EMRT-3]MDI7775008.1 ATP-binding cassette domain-containing protein [Asticcacaulis sp. EMRT-3]